ncbi:hypothetical protein K3557_19490 [Leisingera sp. M523]|nr:hypothetical protein K3557_19490 [Leisingera sp. M523]
MIAAFRRHTLLPLDDCLYALQPSIPHLTRPALHRCLQRHGISRLPDAAGDKPKRQRFKRYPIHCPAVHVHMHGVWPATGQDVSIAGGRSDDWGRGFRMPAEQLIAFS